MLLLFDPINKIKVFEDEPYKSMHFYKIDILEPDTDQILYSTKVLERSPKIALEVAQEMLLHWKETGKWL